MRYRVSCSFLLLLAAGILSEASPAGQNSYPVVTEIKDGVKTIVNPDFPRDGRWKAKLVEEMSCGDAGESDALLHRPTELKVDGQGRIFVMDWGGFCIRVYDDRGAFIGKIGRPGQGPGEFASGASFDLISGNRLCILDGGQGRVMIMSGRNEYLSSFPLAGRFNTLAVDLQDRVYLGKLGAAKEPNLTTEYQLIPYVTNVFRTDPAGKELVHLVDLFGESAKMKSQDKGGIVQYVGGGYMGSVVWNVDGQGKIYGGFNGEYRLTAYDSEARVRFVFGRHFKPLKNPLYKGMLGQRRTIPAFTRNLVFDEKDQIWIELYGKDDAKDYLYDVFSPDGIYLKQVRIATRISQFMKGKLYSLIRSDDEEPAVKRFSMELIPDKR